jgi:PPOX class probable F420-dependent enzyme
MAQFTLDLSNPGQARAEERLRNDIVAWLVSVRPDGRPHAVIVWFLWHEGSILVFSKPNNQKLRNIEKNPNVLIVMDDSKGGNQPILFEGTAELVKDGSISAELPPYAEKYAEKFKQYNWTPASMAQEYSEPIRITPTRYVGP